MVPNTDGRVSPGRSLRGSPIRRQTDFAWPPYLKKNNLWGGKKTRIHERRKEGSTSSSSLIFILVDSKMSSRHHAIHPIQGDDHITAKSGDSPKAAQGQETSFDNFFEELDASCSFDGMGSECEANMVRQQPRRPPRLNMARLLFQRDLSERRNRSPSPSSPSSPRASLSPSRRR
jgi:hypothetical protein